MATQKRRRLAILFAIFILLMGGMYALIHKAVVPIVTTDVDDYEWAREEWRTSELIDHFPAKVPSTATKVMLSMYMSRFPGGSHHLQHRLRLPIQDVDQIEQSLADNAEYVLPGGGEYGATTAEGKWVGTTRFHTADGLVYQQHLPAGTAFPSDFTLYVLKAIPLDKDNWDKGESSGIAVSRQASEVVYWAAVW